MARSSHSKLFLKVLYKFEPLEWLPTAFLIKTTMKYNRNEVPTPHKFAVMKGKECEICIAYTKKEAAKLLGVAIFRVYRYDA